MTKYLYGKNIFDMLIAYSLVEVCLFDNVVTNYDLKILREAYHKDIDFFLKECGCDISLDECVKKGKSNNFIVKFKNIKNILLYDPDWVFTDDYKYMIKGDLEVYITKLITAFKCLSVLMLGLTKSDMNNEYLNTTFIKFCEGMLKK